MILPEHDLRAIIAGTPVGETPPYSTRDPKQIEDFLHKVANQLGRSPLLEVDADFNHYGSGYASYVHVFCTKAKGRATTHKDGVDHIDGITVYLGRLARFAAYGAESRTKHHTGGSASFLDVRNLGTTPPGDWSAALDEIRETLSRNGFTVATTEEYGELLPFQAKIPTIFGDTHVFDAIFYWED
jgi:hypothetical protein